MSYSNITKLLLFSYLSLTISCQIISISQQLIQPVQNGDLSFLRALNNYFGCKVWINGQCTECSQHYMFNDNMICCQITPQCMKFNRGVGICQQCYLGYDIYDGKCVLKDLADSVDKGCKKFKDGQCQQCSVRWYFGGWGYCQQVSDLCRKWDQITGKCTACYLGYNLQGGECLVDSLVAVETIDIYCSAWRNGACLECSQRAYFGPVGLCIPVSDYCRTWDNYDGFCLTCYRGYNLLNGQCVQSPENNQGPSDIGCHRWDWENQICLECSSRWVFDRTGTCMPVSDDCKFYNQRGQCSQCYKGYDLENGECVFSPKNLQAPSDIGCRLWNWDDMICIECSQRWTFNQDGICIPVSNDCKLYNNQTGVCTACYRGYDLENNECVLSKLNTMEPTDPGCKIWDWEEQICLQCSHRWYFNSVGTCKKVPDLCKTFNFSQCTSCYPGYQLSQGTCIVIENDYCEIRQNNICLECYPGYKLVSGTCELGNPLCRQSDQQGNCTSCFTTYVLYKKICVPLVKLVNLAQYYASCCPDKLAELKREGRIA